MCYNEYTMNLYDEADLISNIRGPYQDREFALEEMSVGVQKSTTSTASLYEEELLPPLFEAKPSLYSRKERLQKSTRESQKSYKTEGQLARELAREDIRRKKSAAYLQDDRPHPARVVRREPIHPVAENRVEHLAQLANHLRQEEYILADMPAVYSLNKENREEKTAVKKNSYDFLKKSQVYNYPERQLQRERQMAQELKLTHIEEESQ